MFTYRDYETVSLDGRRIYVIDDNLYPSITTVLSGTRTQETSNALEAWRNRIGHKKADKVSTDAATRGTNLHLMMERALGGQDPKLDEFPQEHVNMFKSLRLETRKINKVFGQEVVLFSHTMQMAGRCDLVGEYNGEIAIVDYKTSTRVKSEYEIGDYWLQIAFYATAHNEMFGTDINKMVILMGVENKLPMVFKKTIDDELLLKLSERVCDFYAKL